MTGIEQPRYAREDITTGIVHFGVGNFHRSHQAMFLDRLFNRGEALDWGICGVGVLPTDVRMRDALEAQDCRYTLVERHADGTTPARTIGSIVEYLFAPDDPEAVFEKLANPTTRIVSLTITEGGYNTSDATGEFDATDPAVLADLERDAIPATVFGIVVEGLRRRRARGLAPFTIMSCDNLEDNGVVARRSFTAFARLLDPEFAEWMSREVLFPNSMVDRITPVTTDDDRRFVRQEFAIDDAWPVLSEPFVQWVLEDRFTLGRPPLENVGVQVVQDVAPYERMKLRLLNASHQAMAYFGLLFGHEFAHEAASDPLIIELLVRYMNDEATPTLGPVPGIDLAEYKRTLIQRFANPNVRDTLARLATDASDRISKFLLPVVHDLIATGATAPLSAAVVASWAAFASRTNTGVTDRQVASVASALARQKSDPVGFLRDAELFGNLAEVGSFAGAFASAYNGIATRDAREALARALALRLDDGFATLIANSADLGDLNELMAHPETVREMFRNSIRAIDGADFVDEPVASVVDSLVSVDGRSIAVRTYEPAGELRATMVYLHGGGFIVGDFDTHDKTTRRLAAGAGIRVVSANYRLAPEHPFPNGLDDAIAIVEWAAAAYADAPLLVGGDSAGGNLAAAASARLVSSSVIDGQVLLYPVLQESLKLPSRLQFGEGYVLTVEQLALYRDLYIGRGLATPSFAFPGDADSFAGLPPTIVFVGGFDPLVDDSINYVERLQAAGTPAELVVFPELIHGFVDFTTIVPAASVARDELVAMLDRFIDSLPPTTHHQRK